MKSGLKSGIIGCAVGGLALAGAGAQAAAQATPNEHPNPSVQKPTPGPMTGMERMKDMDAMMADPAMRQKMLERMDQCRDMMSMMMEHMEHEGRMREAGSPRPKH